MLDVYRKIWEMLDRRERRRSLMILVMVLLMGFVESTRIASLVPFVAVLAQPELVTTNRYLSVAYHWFGFTSTNQFLLFLGIGLFVIVLCSQAFSAATTWATTRFMALRSFNLSRRLFAGYLDRPYEWFLRRHSGDLGSAVLSEATLAISGALSPALQLLTQGVVAAAIVILLVLVDPLLAVIVTAALGGLYLLVLWATRRYLNRIGMKRLLANHERHRISGEAFGGIKDVKVLGLEKTFLRRFEKPSLRVAREQARSDLVGQLPQYAMQSIAFAVVLVIVWYQISVRGNLAQALPVIALYAAAGSRLMPALNSIYQSAARLTYSKPGLDALHRDLVEQPFGLQQIEGGRDGVKPLGLRDRLELRAVGYCYPSAAAPALKNISLVVPARGAVGLVGRTGAGKTTLVDVILGLLEPNPGELIVDGSAITAANRRAWQRSVGYVPQHIFLSDDTVAANIAFGIPPAEIDRAAVERAAMIANLHEFIIGELGEGYDTLVGERGVRLSGGQRQRIGIARALYRDPDLLIMDEGTSALDNVTERAVMEAVNNLSRRKTIILIAHRLSTVRHCDTIFMLDRGRLTASGTYDELAATDRLFREMIDGVVGLAER